VAFVLLVAAGLMLRSFVNLMSVPLGFTPDRVVTAWMPVSFRQFPNVNVLSDNGLRLHRVSVLRNSK
jgi:hypothetical protein